MTNAPSTLPSPPLFPGEILRMQQHRVVCTNAFNEPAVGVVYLTNFRIVFNGSPISVSQHNYLIYMTSTLIVITCN